MSRVLIVSRSCPFPVRESVGGIFKRLRLLLAIAAQITDELECLFFVSPASGIGPHHQSDLERELKLEWGIVAMVKVVPWQDEPASDWINFYIKAALSVTAQPRFSPLLGMAQKTAVTEALARRPDWILAHRLQPMVLLAQLTQPLPPVIFDLDDLEHVSHFRSCWRNPEWPMERLRVLQVPALMWAERRAALKAKLTLVCSNIDADHLRKITTAHSKIHPLRNPATLTSNVTRSLSGKSLAFVGAYSFGPNADAAGRLLNEVFPIVRAAMPDAELHLVGALPELIPGHGSGNKPGVHFHGFVDDLNEFYGGIDLVCCPIRVGSGTRLKILEAAAYAVPVVSTRLGAEGLDFQHGQDILHGETAQELAAHCLKLLRDSAYARQIGNAAKHKVEKLYAFDALVLEGTSIFADALRCHT